MVLGIFEAQGANNLSDVKFEGPKPNPDLLSVGALFTVL